MPYDFPNITHFNFNSIKVRLERLSSICILLLLLDFNSIKVRLEQHSLQDWLDAN